MKRSQNFFLLIYVAIIYRPYFIVYRNSMRIFERKQAK